MSRHARVWLLGVAAGFLLGMLYGLWMAEENRLEGARLEREALVAIPLPAPRAELLRTVLFGRVSYYQAVPAQTDADPFTSACGPNLEQQVAVSRDLFRGELGCGDRIRVFVGGQHEGVYTVWDTMHPRFEDTLDILVSDAPPWGLSYGYGVVVD